MPDHPALEADQDAHATAQVVVAQRLAKKARVLRETYIPRKLDRLCREEQFLEKRFDALAVAIEAGDARPEALKALLDIEDRLIRIRSWMRDSLGWPKPPTLRNLKLPSALEMIRSGTGLAAHQDAEVVPVVPKAAKRVWPALQTAPKRPDAT